MRIEPVTDRVACPTVERFTTRPKLHLDEMNGALMRIYQID